MKTATILLGIILLAGAVSAEDLAVTVYNSNLGVISETRSLNFDKGLGRVAFRDVPHAIDANSVRFKLTDASAEVAILEQNYVYDLVSKDQIYKKYIDKEIELIDKEGTLFSGSLIAFGGGTVTLQEQNGRIKIILMDKITEVNFPSLPDGLVTRPTLFWLYQSSKSGDMDCNVSYQTSGMNWAAEYVGLVSADETKLDLSGWAAIDNNSGKTYRDAALKLVAGDIHRAQRNVPTRSYEKFATASMAETDGFAEKEFFEYHLYTLPRKATLADRETKQISLFDPAATGIEKVFTYKPDMNPKGVSVSLKFTNSKAAGMGMPLPAGRLRMFKADDDGSLVLLGEDRIKHTPRDEEVSVTVGTAFDIVAEERTTDQKRISQRVEERSFEIEIRNRKKEAVTVEIEKKLWGDWEILESSLEYEKKDAYTVRFDMPAAGGETVILSLRVRFQH